MTNIPTSFCQQRILDFEKCFDRNLWTTIRYTNIAAAAAAAVVVRPLIDCNAATSHDSSIRCLRNKYFVCILPKIDQKWKICKTTEWKQRKQPLNVKAQHAYTRFEILCHACDFRCKRAECWLEVKSKWCRRMNFAALNRFTHKAYSGRLWYRIYIDL